MPRVTKITNPSKRNGTSDKGIAWNIMEIEVEKEDGSLVRADSFDTLVDGDIVELEPNNYTNPNTGKTYNGWNAKLPRAPKKSGGGTDMTEVMEAIRMVFRKVKDIEDQTAEILAGVKALMGPPEEDPPAVITRPPEQSMPADFGLKEDDPRHPNNQTPETTPEPARDWQNVGQRPAPAEPITEPLPEEPADLESFMNG